MPSTTSYNHLVLILMKLTISITLSQGIYHMLGIIYILTIVAVTGIVTGLTKVAVSKLFLRFIQVEICSCLFYTSRHSYLWCKSTRVYPKCKYFRNLFACFLFNWFFEWVNSNNLIENLVVTISLQRYR